MQNAGFTSFDAHMMQIALAMARRGLGRAAPNPSVGAVIANERTEEVIARAVTAPGGRPHAETQAISAAGGRAKDATIYVTLEPCSHTGTTGPCADAIVAAGISRVVAAIEDPDPRVAGRGLDKLRAAGITVQRGLGAAEARWITRGHVVRLTERRPLITLKLALDSHGEVPRGENGRPQFVTCTNARAHGHLLRSQADAILVGAGTVRDDDPDLTCRLPGLEHASPVRVVLSQSFGVATSSKIFAAPHKPETWVVCGPGIEAASFDREGVRIVRAATGGGRLWLPSVMEELVARGITRILVEGGPTLWQAFATAGLVDEVVLYLAGGAGVLNEAPARAAVSRWLGGVPVELKESRALDVDRLWRFRRT